MITYTRTWAPGEGVISWPLVREFLEKFYDWQPDITPDECAALGLSPVASFKMRGQEITVYVRDSRYAGRTL
ncbi:MAG: hypothetical protein JO270_02660 [Acidobacteriaceae bacterium]|nr:hypothetical protein [Acidobacteriaceae bacterium]